MDGNGCCICGGGVAVTLHAWVPREPVDNLPAYRGEVLAFCAADAREWFQRLVNLTPLEHRLHWLEEMPKKAVARG